jgi:hypothetical protein
MRWFLSPALLSSVSLVSGVLSAAPASVEAELAPANVSAEQEPALTQQPKPQQSEPASRFWPASAAVVPGLVVHGAGHYALGEKQTARNLLWMEASGLALFLTGGLTIVLTGASRYLVGPSAALTMAGFGLFSTSYMADIYGTLSKDGGAVLSRYRAPAIWETELGYRRVADSQFAYEDFLVERVSRSVGPFRLSPSAWFSMKGDTARYRLETQYRFAGSLAGSNISQAAGGGLPPSPDASFADLTLGFVHQRHAPERFTKSSAELSVDGRYDLARLGPTLRGAFVELSAGYALGRIDYDAIGLEVPHDLEHLLLGRFGFGVLLRGQSAPGSEAVVYYDHRHDDYAAGLKLKGLGSGVIGHFGLGLRWFFNESVGIAGDAQVGSAYIAGASLLYRQGSRP